MNKKVIRGLKWAFAEQAGVQIISFLVFLLLARLLGPSAFGLIALSQAFIMVVTRIVQQGFATAIVQRSEIDQVHLCTAFWSNLFFSLIALCIVNFFAGSLAIAFDDPELESIIRALSIIFLITPAWVIQQAIFKRELNFKPLAIQSIIGITCANVVAVVLAVAGFGVWSLVAREIVNVVICSIALWLVSDWRPSFSFSRQKFEELWSYAWHVLKGNTVLFLGARADTLIIGYGLGRLELGYYHVAKRVVMLLNQLFSQTIEKVAMPVYARLQSDSAALLRTYQTSNEAAGFLLAPVYLGVILISTELVPLVFGSHWIKSVIVMQVLLAAGLLQSLVFLNIALLMGIGRADLRTRIITIDTVLKTTAIAIAVNYGLLPTAIAVFIVGLTMLPIWILSTAKELSLSLRKYSCYFLPSFVCSVVMVSGVIIVHFHLSTAAPESWLLLTAKIVSGIVFYGLAALLMFRSFVRDLSSKTKFQR